MFSEFGNKKVLISKNIIFARKLEFTATKFIKLIQIRMGGEVAEEGYRDTPTRESEKTVFSVVFAAELPFSPSTPETELLGL